MYGHGAPERRAARPTRSFGLCAASFGDYHVLGTTWIAELINIRLAILARFSA